MKKSILITLLSALCALGQAQTLTLEECYELARANFPQVRRLQLIERTRDCNLANAAKGWLPTSSSSALPRQPTSCAI